MNIPRSFLLGICAMLLLAGCGASATSAPASPAASASAFPDSRFSHDCSMAPKAMVNAVLGLGGVSEARETGAGGVDSCTYNVTRTDGTVVVEVVHGSSPGKMAGEEKGLAKSETVRPYRGLGDQAFLAVITTGETSNTLVARKGAVEVSVVSGASPVRERNLENELLARITS